MSNISSNFIISYLITFLLYIAAVVIPRTFQQLATWKNVMLTLGVMFAASLIGGLAVHWLNGQDAGMIFSRIFSTAALSHIIIYAAYMEVYLRLQTRQIQIDHASREAAKEEDTPPHNLV